MSSDSDFSSSSNPSPKVSSFPNRISNLKSQKSSLTRIVKAQVTLLVSNLNADNYTRNTSEIKSVCISFNFILGSNACMIWAHSMRLVCRYSNALWFTAYRNPRSRDLGPFITLPINRTFKRYQSTTRRFSNSSLVKRKRSSIVIKVPATSLFLWSLNISLQEWISGYIWSCKVIWATRIQRCRVFRLSLCNTAWSQARHIATRLVVVSQFLEKWDGQRTPRAHMSSSSYSVKLHQIKLSTRILVYT